MPIVYEELMAMKNLGQKYSYSDREVMLYAYGIGMGADPMDERELAFVNEATATPRALKVVPTFASVAAWGAGLLRHDADLEEVDLAGVLVELRLKLALDPQQLPMAMDLLTAAALASLDMPTAERLAQEYEQAADLTNILGILVHDGYLQLAGQVYIFESKLVRDWWRHRHAATYKPPRTREAP